MAGITFSKSSGVNNSVFGKSEAPIRKFLESNMETYEKNSAVDKIFSIDSDNNYSVKLTGMTSMDGFQPVGEGGAYPNDGMQEGYSKILEHVVWKDSFKITQEMVEDDKVIDFKKAPTAFLKGFHRTREQFGAALIGGALSGTTTNFKNKSFDTTSADGVSVFSKEHPSILDGTFSQSNLFAGAFSNSNLVKLECKMQDFRDDNHNVLDIAPDTILIPNDATLKAAVFAAIGADKDPATANNGFNYNFGRWTIIVWSYLNQYIKSGTSPYILIDSNYNEIAGGAVWYDRIKLNVSSYVDDNTDVNVWKGRARFIAGFNDWRAMAVGGITGGSAL